MARELTLLAIVDLATCAKQGADPIEVVRALAAEGVPRVLLRGKDDATALERVARALAAAPRSYLLLLHGHADLVAALKLDGIHLASGADACAARAVVGSDRLVGVSTHTLDEVKAAQACADYLTLSPVFLTASKPGYGPALGVEAFGLMAAQASCDVYALAGVQPSHLTALALVGAAGVAVMGPLCHADAAARAQRYLEALPSGSS